MDGGLDDGLAASGSCGSIPLDAVDQVLHDPFDAITANLVESLAPCDAHASRWGAGRRFDANWVRNGDDYLLGSPRVDGGMAEQAGDQGWRDELGGEVYGGGRSSA